VAVAAGGHTYARTELAFASAKATKAEAPAGAAAATI
jgi:hypothetical protein